MPKMKTKKTAAARFKISGTGKVLRSKGGMSHLRLHKPKKTRRQYALSIPLSKADQRRIKRLMPYGAGKS